MCISSSPSNMSQSLLQATKMFHKEAFTNVLFKNFGKHLLRQKFCLRSHVHIVWLCTWCRIVEKNSGSSIHRPLFKSKITQITLALYVVLSFFTARAMLARYMLSSCVYQSVRPSVSPSVTSRSSIKMAKPRITQTTRYDSPGTLVFWSQNYRRNSNEIPNGGAK